MKTLKLGTRRSLLAWAQSQWVARQVERLNPEIRVELVGIETQGDRIQDIPLSKIEGKEFFVAELDQALATEQVDFSVHSLKDLSLERPAEFTIAAIPEREDPRDWMIVRRGTFEIRNRKIKIGTSSPRRIENLIPFFERAYPDLQFEMVEIRGNVNGRLARVHLSEQSPKHCDGVILAAAGLNRLWADDKARLELEVLFQQTDTVVLPLDQNPTAPGQGALAVECRKKDLETVRALARLHHEPSRLEIGFEREVLAHFGGGCHQRFGATQTDGRLIVLGRAPDGSAIREKNWNAESSQSPAMDWDGSAWNQKLWVANHPLAVEIPSCEGRLVFVAHSRALEVLGWDRARALLSKSQVWVSGFSSWKKLAAESIRVSGSTEGQGFATLQSWTHSRETLRLPEMSEWLVLTHRDGLGDWKDEPGSPQVIATYSSEYRELSPEEQSELAQARKIFWASGSQYRRLSHWVSDRAQHFCGPGKTLEFLKKQGKNPQVIHEWERI
jgi:hydroxymethylbilane synthase